MMTDTEIRAKIGEILRLIRQAFKLNQADAAEKAGISRSTLIAIEKGSSTSSTAPILAILAWYMLNANPVVKLLLSQIDIASLIDKLNKKDK